ncbi:GNAT family N-acetyltransferase [Deinococcus irradiatisoli]|uniref:GNAT family N-acetyltransferase n=1 Tax=Deinococcus irradiatisoli TaxID=2202254 RepID=A0A2Z3JN21_9DEIO|nr:GNAT family protein [Deinococcus irradiatisoli]AWN24189.1 GNAT family N-acetyltransferase [Deinococcus irradiatisoli]
MAELASPELTLRPQTARDALQLALWLTDPAAEWRQWDAPYLHGEQLSEGDLDAEEVEEAEESPHERLICLGGAPIGLVTRHPEPPRSGGWWELGILIYDPHYWSGGLGTRALRQWTTLTFEETGAHVLTLTTWSGNARMLRAGARAGYRECARVRQARLWRGERYDSVRLDLLRSEWAQAPSEPKNE